MEPRSFPRRILGCAFATAVASAAAVALHLAVADPLVPVPAGASLDLVAAWWIGTAARRGYGAAGWLPVGVALAGAHLAAGIAPLAGMAAGTGLAGVQDPAGLLVGLGFFAVVHPLAVLREGGAPAILNLLAAVLSAWAARPIRAAQDVTTG